jgi:hypothetical protein
MLEHLQAKNPQARKMVALGLPKATLDATSGSFAVVKSSGTELRGVVTYSSTLKF